MLGFMSCNLMWREITKPLNGPIRQPAFHDICNLTRGAAQNLNDSPNITNGRCTAIDTPSVIGFERLGQSHHLHGRVLRQWIHSET